MNKMHIDIHKVLRTCTCVYRCLCEVCIYIYSEFVLLALSRFIRNSIGRRFTGWLKENQERETRKNARIIKRPLITVIHDLGISRRGRKKEKVRRRARERERERGKEKEPSRQLLCVHFGSSSLLPPFYQPSFFL